MAPGGPRIKEVTLCPCEISADDIESETIEVPSWGVTIEVRSMDGRSRTQLMKRAANADGTVDLERLYPEVVIVCSHDPATGERIFTEQDRDALLSKSAAALELVALTAMQVSGMTGQAQAEAGKDLPSTANDDSSSS